MSIIILKGHMELAYSHFLVPAQRSVSAHRCVSKLIHMLVSSISKNSIRKFYKQLP